MIKKILIICVLLIAPVVLTACAVKKDNSQQINNSGQPDFVQPTEKPDITGIVESITGNEVVILKIDWPQKNQNQNPGTENGGSQSNPYQNGGTAANLGSGMGIVGSQGGQGFRENGGGQGGPQEGQFDRTAMLENLKKMSSGEEKITIPVGIQMLKPDSDLQQNNTGAGKNQQKKMVEANLNDIKAEKMISIWLDKNSTDKKIASFVVITGGFGG